VVTSMSSRIIRGADRTKTKSQVKTSDGGEVGLLGQDYMMSVEKQAFEQGYREGEKIGKQMGEKMMETVIKRYENSIVELAQSHKSLVAEMEENTVRMALEISRKIVQRELTIDLDLVTALAAVALKRVQTHESITLRVSRHDCPRVRAAVAAVNAAVQVKDDASLERGDFVVDTAQTHLDGRISRQIDTIGKALFDE